MARLYPIPRAPIVPLAIVGDTDSWPVSGPPSAAYAALQRCRYQVSVAPQFQGATIQRTDPVPPVSQPDQASYAMPRQASRWMVAAPPQIHQGATRLQTHPTPAVSQPEQRWFSLALNSRLTQPVIGSRLDSTVAPQSYIFPLPTVIVSYRFRMVKAPFVAHPATAQQTSIFPVAQPDPARVSSFLQQARYLIAAPPRLDGATIQQTYGFLLGQPDQPRFSATQRHRFLVDATRRTDGASAIQAQTYEFFPAQPEMRSFLAALNAWRAFAGPAPQLTGATNQQTYIFTPPPELIRYDLPDINRYAPTGPQKQVTGATVQQGSIFPVSNPEARWYGRQRPDGTIRLVDFPAAAPRIDLFTLLQPARQYYRQPVLPALWIVIQDSAVIARVITLNARFNATIALTAGFNQTLSTNARFNPTIPLNGET